MADDPLASIVVNNYNYGRFLSEAIDSALAQTYPHTEVIVVDDGSVDGSRAVIAGYRDRITAVLQENGGQTSALNAGFQASRGTIVVFLDADDLLLPTAITSGVELFRDPAIVHVHWPLLEMNEQSRTTGKVVPAKAFPQGNLREEVVRKGPDGLVWSPTSGNAWHSRFLRQHFPLPVMEKKCRAGSAAADARLSVLAPLYGRVQRVRQPQACYRIHGNNDYSAMPFANRLAFDRLIFDELCDLLALHAPKVGLSFNRETAQQSGWVYRLQTAVREITAVVPHEKTFILVDDDTWGADGSLGIQPIPFLENAGVYFGPPPDDDTAIRELERLRQRGAGYIAFAWPAFWWLEHYHAFSRFLHERFPCVLHNERLAIFDLR